MALKSFVRGSSVYSCCVCARRTRATSGEHSETARGRGHGICEECYELAGIENEISDGYKTLEERMPVIKDYLALIEKKGGDISEWKQTFEIGLPR